MLIFRAWATCVFFKFQFGAPACELQKADKGMQYEKLPRKHYENKSNRVCYVREFPHYVRESKS